VHGGSNETNELTEKLGLTPRFITTVTGFTSRYTDRKTLEIFAMATGKINLVLVEQLQKAGVNAVGLSGVDGRLLCAKRNEAIKIVENGKRMVIRDDFTGKIEQVNAGLLQTLLAAGLTPVIQPLAISEAGDALNVDADRAAAMIAGAHGRRAADPADQRARLMRSFPDESTVIPHIERKQVECGAGFGRRPHEEKGAGRHGSPRPGRGQNHLCRWARRASPAGGAGRQGHVSSRNRSRA
jgi:[amino group carrier protein]-L-2-aminoadipate 6-kinase